MQNQTHEWRLIIDKPQSPAWNMAVDEALMINAQIPTLRLYQWNPPALSLGYFQKIADFDPSLAESLGAVIVRRSTGGGAILHDRELTYSISGELKKLHFIKNNLELYGIFHKAIILALKKLNIEASERNEATLLSDNGPRMYCFAKSASMDVIVGGRKIAGSAQRKKGDRILMHGSIFLEPNRLVPLAASVSEAIGRQISFNEFAELFVDAIKETTGARLNPHAMTSEEISAAETISNDKYSTQWWTNKF